MKILFNHDDKVIVQHSDWRDGFDFSLRLLQDDGSYKVIQMPATPFREAIVDYIRMLRIDRLEQMSDADVLGLSSCDWSSNE